MVFSFELGPQKSLDTILINTFDAKISIFDGYPYQLLLDKLNRIIPLVGGYVFDEYLEEIRLSSYNNSSLQLKKIESAIRVSSSDRTTPTPLDFSCNVTVGSFKFEDGKIVVSNRAIILLVTALVAVGQYPNIRQGVIEITQDLSNAKTHIERSIRGLDPHTIRIENLKDDRKPPEEIYKHLVLFMRDDDELPSLLKSMNLPPFE